MPVTDSRRLRERLDAALDAAARAPDAPAPPDGDARARLVAFVELLARWNRVWNLTAVREPAEMLDRHVLDALTLLPFVDAELGAGPGTGSGAGSEGRNADDRDGGQGRGPDAPPRFDLIDVGSGAGLPGLVLAIVRPGLDLLSIERTSKKARFQRQAAIELGLGRAVVRDERVEAVRARAPLVTSRAFAAPAGFLTAAGALTAPGGAALVMLGRAERLPGTLPEGWTLERTAAVAGASDRTSGAAAGDGAPARHVALCRRTPIPYDRAP